jgi:hypothetical protein
VAVDARRHAVEHPHFFTVEGAEALELRDLEEVIGNDAANVAADGVVELVGGLGVAVEDDGRGIDARLERGVELAAGDDVETEAFLGDDAAHVEGLEGFAGVDGGGVGVFGEEGRAHGSAAPADRSLGDHVERSAVALCELDGGDAIEEKDAAADFRSRVEVGDAHGRIVAYSKANFKRPAAGKTPPPRLKCARKLTRSAP